MASKVGSTNPIKNFFNRWSSTQSLNENAILSTQPSPLHEKPSHAPSKHPPTKSKKEANRRSSSTQRHSVNLDDLPHSNGDTLDRTVSIKTSASVATNSSRVPNNSAQTGNGLPRASSTYAPVNQGKTVEKVQRVVLGSDGQVGGDVGEKKKGKNLFTKFFANKFKKDDEAKNANLSKSKILKKNNSINIPKNSFSNNHNAMAYTGLSRDSLITPQDYIINSSTKNVNLFKDTTSLKSFRDFGNSEFEDTDTILYYNQLTTNIKNEKEQNQEDIDHNETAEVDTNKTFDKNNDGVIINEQTFTNDKVLSEKNTGTLSPSEKLLDPNKTDDNIGYINTIHQENNIIANLKIQDDDSMLIHSAATNNAQLEGLEISHVNRQQLDSYISNSNICVTNKNDLIIVNNTSQEMEQVNTAKNFAELIVNLNKNEDETDSVFLNTKDSNLHMKASVLSHKLIESDNIFDEKIDLNNKVYLKTNDNYDFNNNSNPLNEITTVHTNSFESNEPMNSTFAEAHNLLNSTNNQIDLLDYNTSNLDNSYSVINTSEIVEINNAYAKLISSDMNENSEHNNNSEPKIMKILNDDKCNDDADLIQTKSNSVNYFVSLSNDNKDSKATKNTQIEFKRADKSKTSKHDTPNIISAENNDSKNMKQNTNNNNTISNDYFDRQSVSSYYDVISKNVKSKQIIKNVNKERPTSPYTQEKKEKNSRMAHHYIKEQSLLPDILEIAGLKNNNEHFSHSLKSNIIINNVYDKSVNSIRTNSNDNNLAVDLLRTEPISRRTRQSIEADNRPIILNDKNVKNDPNTYKRLIHDRLEFENEKMGNSKRNEIINISNRKGSFEDKRYRANSPSETLNQALYKDLDKFPPIKFASLQRRDISDVHKKILRRQLSDVDRLKTNKKRMGDINSQLKLDIEKWKGKSVDEKEFQKSHNYIDSDPWRFLSNSLENLACLSLDEDRVGSQIEGIGNHLISPTINYTPDNRQTVSMVNLNAAIYAQNTSNHLNNLQENEKMLNINNNTDEIIKIPIINRKSDAYTKSKSTSMVDIFNHPDVSRIGRSSSINEAVHKTGLIKRLSSNSMMAIPRTALAKLNIDGTPKSILKQRLKPFQTPPPSPPAEEYDEDLEEYEEAEYLEEIIEIQTDF